MQATADAAASDVHGDREAAFYAAGYAAAVKALKAVRDLDIRNSNGKSIK